MDTSLVEYNAEWNLMLDLQRIVYIGLLSVILFMFIHGSVGKTHVEVIPEKEEEGELEPQIEDEDEDESEPSIDDKINALILEKAKLEKHQMNEILNYIDALNDTVDAVIDDIARLKNRLRYRVKKN